MGARRHLARILEHYYPERKGVMHRQMSRFPNSPKPRSAAAMHISCKCPVPPLSAIGLNQFADFENMNAIGITSLDTSLTPWEREGLLPWWKWIMKWYANWKNHCKTPKPRFEPFCALLAFIVLFHAL